MSEKFGSKRSELLGFCQQNNLLILNGRTVGDECGQCTFQSACGKSTVDYFIASVHCMTAAKSLHVLEEAARYGSDHNHCFCMLPVIQFSLHTPLTHLQHVKLECGMMFRGLKRIRRP